MFSHIKLQQGLREGRGTLNGLRIKKKPNHKRKTFQMQYICVSNQKSVLKKRNREVCFSQFSLWCFAKPVTSQDVLLSSLP